jgi:hypothetical protein
MNDSISNDRAPAPQAGPPLGWLAVVSGGLLVAGIIVSALLGGVIPSPFGPGEAILRYFATQPDAVRASGILGFGSSVPLAIYAATASARLRQLDVTAPGATIALAGGILAAGALSLSGLVQWTLSQPAVRADAPLVRALQDLAFLAGGPAHVIFLGLLVAGIAVPALILRLTPAPLAWAGLVIAGLAELTTLTLIWPALAGLLPAARFPALAWLIAAGFVLPRRRPRGAARSARPAVSAGGTPSDAAGRAASQDAGHAG